MNDLVIIVALLAAPVAALVGVLAGAVLAYRLGKGLSPLPPLPARAKVIEPQKTPEPRPIPRMRA